MQRANLLVNFTAWTEQANAGALFCRVHVLVCTSSWLCSWHWILSLSHLPKLLRLIIWSADNVLCTFVGSPSYVHWRLSGEDHKEIFCITSLVYRLRNFYIDNLITKQTCFSYFFNKHESSLSLSRDPISAFKFSSKKRYIRDLHFSFAYTSDQRFSVMYRSENVASTVHCWTLFHDMLNCWINTFIVIDGI